MNEDRAEVISRLKAEAFTVSSLLLNAIFKRKNMEEVWKDIPNYEGLYQVSNLGRVKSLPKQVKRKYIVTTKERILVNNLSGCGYYHVGLSNGVNYKLFRVNVLVAMAFLNYIPNGRKNVVDHINNIKTDNRVDNLQIISHRLNCTKDKINKKSNLVGAHWNCFHNKWQSCIKIDGKNIFIGRYKTEKEAHLAYINKLKEIENERR